MQAGLDVDRQAVAALLEQRTGHLDRLGQRPIDVDLLDLQLDLAARRARHVHQVVHQAHQVIDLALDDLALAQRCPVAAHAHQLQRGDDRRERVAQLMAEHGQEFVLGAVGCRQFFQQALAFGMGALQAAPAAHLLGDVGRHQDHTLLFARRAAQRLQAELEEALLAFAAGARQLDAQLLDRERCTGAVGLFEQPGHLAAAPVGKGVEEAAPFQVGALDQFAVAAVGEAEGEFRSRQQGRGDRGVEQHAVALRQRLVALVAQGGVAREAARVAQFAVLEVAVRMDHHVPDRAVLAAQARRLVVQGLARGQFGQDAVDDRGVDVEVGDVAADVLFPGIAQHLQFGAVGPEDGAVARHPVQALGGVLDEVGEFLLAPAQGLLGLPAACDLGFHLHGALFVVQVRGRGRVDRGAVRMAALAMLGAYLAEGSGVLGGREQPPRISAEQGKIELFAQIVPELLEAHGGVVLAARAQQGDHLAKGVHAAAAGAGGRQHGTQRRAEQPRVGLAVDHEDIQGLLGVERDQLAGEPGGAAVGVAETGQAATQLRHVFWRGDHDAGAAGAQGRVEEIGDFVEQDVVVIVEADKMGAVARGALRRLVWHGQQIGLH